MTKLMEWLAVASVAFGIWFSVVFKFVQNEFLDKWMFIVIPSPIILVGLFGIYAITVVLYGSLTLNDCEYAAKELQEQIIEAKSDLKDKGFVFEN